MKWFQHMSNANGDDKLVELHRRWGIWGIGVYWDLVARVADQMKYSDPVPAAKIPVQILLGYYAVRRQKLHYYLTTATQLRCFHAVIKEDLLHIEIPTLLKLLDESTRKLRNRSGLSQARRGIGVGIDDQEVERDQVQSRLPGGSAQPHAAPLSPPGKSQDQDAGAERSLDASLWPPPSSSSASTGTSSAPPAPGGLAAPGGGGGRVKRIHVTDTTVGGPEDAPGGSTPLTTGEPGAATSGGASAARKTTSPCGDGAASTPPVPATGDESRSAYQHDVAGGPGRCHIPDSRPRGYEHDRITQIRQHHAEILGQQMDGNPIRGEIQAVIVEAIRDYEEHGGEPDACIEALDGWAEERKRPNSQLGETLRSVFRSQKSDPWKLDRDWFWHLVQVGKKYSEKNKIKGPVRHEIICDGEVWISEITEDGEHREYRKGTDPDQADNFNWQEDLRQMREQENQK